MGIIERKTSNIVLMKAVLLHVFQKKSWRRVGWELGISHVTAFQFYRDIYEQEELKKVLVYFIERKIVLYLGEEKNITKEYLESDEIIKKSLDFLGVVIKSL
jgi:hypothetical protein